MGPWPEAGHAARRPAEGLPPHFSCSGHPSSALPPGALRTNGGGGRPPALPSLSQDPRSVKQRKPLVSTLALGLSQWWSPSQAGEGRVTGGASVSEGPEGRGRPPAGGLRHYGLGVPTKGGGSDAAGELVQGGRQAPLPVAIRAQASRASHPDDMLWLEVARYPSRWPDPGTEPLVRPWP